MSPEVTEVTEAIDSTDVTKDEITLLDFAKALHSGNTEDDGRFEEDTALGKNIESYYRKTIVGLSDVEYKILATFTCLPSILCRVLPVIAIIGASGCGKSQISKTCSRLVGADLYAGNSTAASLKNHINKIRWADPSTLSHERNCHLLMDNVNSDTFSDTALLGAYLNGYDRDTDRQYISGGKGENIEFRTFCPKLFTTVWEFESTELRRRCLFVRVKKQTDISSTEDINDINWLTPRMAIKDFWKEPENWTQFVTNRKSVASTAKPAHKKESWNLVRDLLAVGITIGAWGSTSSAIQDMSEFLTTMIPNKGGLLTTTIKNTIEVEIGFKFAQLNAVAATGAKIEVQPKAIKLAIQSAVSEGLIENPKVHVTQNALESLGFATAHGKDGKIVYRYRGLR